jgi:hypothetical protein
MEKGGPVFGFCPSKVLRDDPEAGHVFMTLVSILETNTWPEEGGINAQEDFWVELVAEFGQYRRDLEFNSRYARIFKDVSNGFGKNKISS